VTKLAQKSQKLLTESTNPIAKGLGDGLSSFARSMGFSLTSMSNYAQDAALNIVETLDDMATELNNKDTNFGANLLSLLRFENLKKLGGSVVNFFKGVSSAIAGGYKATVEKTTDYYQNARLGDLAKKQKIEADTKLGDLRKAAKGDKGFGGKAAELYRQEKALKQKQEEERTDLLKSKVGKSEYLRYLPSVASQLIKDNLPEKVKPVAGTTKSAQTSQQKPDLRDWVTGWTESNIQGLQRYYPLGDVSIPDERVSLADPVIRAIPKSEAYEAAFYGTRPAQRVEAYEERDKKGVRLAEFSQLQTPTINPLEQKARQISASALESLQSAASESEEKWSMSTKAIVSSLFGVSKAAEWIGKNIVSRIAENSPGPSEQVRTKWEHTSESVIGSMANMSDAAAESGSAIAKDLTGHVDEVATSAQKAQSSIEVFAMSRGISKGHSWIDKDFNEVWSYIDTLGMSSKIDEESSGTVLGKTGEDELSLLVTGMPTKDRTDNRTRKIRNKLLFRGTPQDEPILRDLAAQSLSGELAPKVDKIISSKNDELGWTADFEQLQPANLGVSPVGMAAPDEAPKIGGWADSNEEMIRELRSTRLPDKEGLLLIIGTGSSEKKLKRQAPWRGMSDIIEGGLQEYTPEEAPTAKAAKSASRKKSKKGGEDATPGFLSKILTAAKQIKKTNDEEVKESKKTNQELGQREFGKTAPSATIAGAMGLTRAGVGTVKMMGAGLIGTASALAGLGAVFEETNPGLARMLEMFSKIGMVAGALGAFVNAPIIAFIALSAAAFALHQAIKSNFLGIGDIVHSILSTIGHAIVNTVNTVFSVFQFFGNLLHLPFGKKKLSATQTLITETGDAIGQAAETIGDATGSASESISQATEVLASDVIGAYFHQAFQQILSAWDGFYDRFGGIIYPIVKPALDVARMLINALNHNPTERIPEAWEGAAERITGIFGWLVEPAKALAGTLTNVLSTPANLLASGAEMFGYPNSSNREAEPNAASNGGSFSKMGGAFSGVGGFFGGLFNQKAQTQEIPIAPVMLDMTQQLGKAMQMALFAGDADAIMPLATTQGNMTAADYAKALQGTGGDYLGKAVGFSNQGFGDRLKGEIGDIFRGDGIGSLVEELQYSNAALILKKLGKDFESMKERGLEAVSDLKVGIQDRFDYIKRYGGIDNKVFFDLPIGKIKNQVDLIGESFKYFGKQAGQAILHLDFDALKESLKGFGHESLISFSAIGDALADLTASAIVFGMVALAGVSPVNLALIGAGIATLLLATNFLGLRSIVAGTIQVVVGFGQVAVGILGIVASTVEFTIDIFKGLKKAFRGDFSDIKSAWDKYLSSLGANGELIGKGIKNIFGGVGKVLRGIGEAAGQVLKFFGLMLSPLRRFSFLVDLGAKGIEKTAEGVLALLGLAGRLTSGFRDGFKALAEMGRLSDEEIKEVSRVIAKRLIQGIKDGIKGVADWIGNAGQIIYQGITSAIEKIVSFTLPILDRIKSAMIAAKDKIVDSFHSMIANLKQFIQDLKDDWVKALLGIKDSAISRFTQIKQSIQQAIQDAIGYVSSKFADFISFLDDTNSAFRALRFIAVAIIQELGVEIDKVLLPTVEQFGVMKGKAVDAFESMQSKGKDLFERLQQYLDWKVIFADSITGVEAIKSGFISLKNKGISAIADIESGIKGWRASLDSVTQRVVEVLGKFQLLMALRFGHLFTPIENTLDAIKPKLETVMGVAGEWSERLSSDFRAAEPQIKSVIANIKETFETIKPHVESIVSNLKTAFQAIQPYLEEIGGKLKSAFMAIQPTLQEVGERMLMIASLKFGNVVNPLLDAFELLSNAVKYVRDHFDSIKSAIGQVADFAQGLIAKFNFLRQNSEAVKDSLLLLGAIKFGEWAIQLEKIGDQFEQIRKLATEVFLYMSGKVSDLITTVKPLVEIKSIVFIEEIKNQVKELPATFEQVTEKIQSAWQQLKENITGHLDKVVDYAKQIGNWLIGALNHNPTERIPEAWRNAIEQIKALYDEWMSHAKDFGNKLVTMLKSKFENIVTDAKGLFQELKNISPSQIVDGLTGDSLKDIKVVFEQLEPVFTQLKQLGGSLADQIVPDIQRIGSELWELIKPTEQVRSAFMSFTSEAKQNIGKVLGGFIKVGSGIKESLSHLTKAPMEILNIGIALKDLAVSFAKIGAELAMMPVDVIAGFVKLGKQLMFAKRMADKAKDSIAVGISEILFSVNQFKREVIESFEALRDRVVPPVKELMQVLSSEFMSLITGQSSIFEFGQKITSTFKEAFGEIVVASKEFVDKVVGSFGEMGDRLKGSIAFFEDGFKSGFIAISESFRGVTQLVDSLVQPLERLAFKIAPELGNSFKSVLSIFGSFGAILKDIVSAIADIKAVPTIFQGIKEIVEAVLSQFKGFKDLANAIFEQFKLGQPHVEAIKVTVASITDSLKTTIAAVTNLGNEFEQTFAKVKGIGDYVVQRAKDDTGQITDKVRGIGAAIGSTFKLASRESRASMKEMADESKKVGKQLQGNLSEASPGPTYWIRKNWAKTADSLSGDMKDMVNTSETTGKLLANSFNVAEESMINSFKNVNDISTKLMKDVVDTIQRNFHQLPKSVQRDMESLASRMPQYSEKIGSAFQEERMRFHDQAGKYVAANQVRPSSRRQEDGQVNRRQLGNSMNMAAMSVGGALSNFAPNLAAPLFMAGDVYDVFDSFGDVSKTFKDSGMTIGKTLTKLANGIKHFAGVFISGVVAIFTSGVSLTGLFASIGTAATAMWTAISGPLLPLVLLIGVIVAAIAIFKYNVFGLGDAFKNLWALIKSIVAPGIKIVTDEFQKAKKLIGGIVSEDMKSLWSLLKQIGNFIVKPFLDFARIGDKSASTSSRLLGLLIDIGKVIGKVVAIGIKAVAILLAAVLKIVGAIAKAVVFVGGSLVYAVMIPVRIVLATLRLVWEVVKLIGAAFKFVWDTVLVIGSFIVQGWITRFQFVYDLVAKVGNVILHPFQTIKSIVAWIAEKLSGLTGLFDKAAVLTGNVKGGIGNMLQGGRNAISGAWEGTKNFFGGLIGQKDSTPGFSQGGFVSGPGTGTSDSILANLSNGEFVVRSTIAQRNAPLLKALNNGESLSTLAVMPPTLPWIPSSTDVAERKATTKEVQPVVMQPSINLNISGDIHLSGATGPEAAEEFLESLGPSLARKVREIIRDMVEFMK
jgi:phage-related protein